MPTPHQTDNHQRGPRRVLIVEDNPDAGRVLGKLLRTAGYVVAVVSDQQLAVATLAGEPTPVDGVIASFTTSGTSAGLRLLDSLRNHRMPTVNNVKVLVVSDNPRQQLFALQTGADELIVRPYHSRELLATIDRMLDRPEQERVASRRDRINQLVTAPNSREMAVAGGGERRAAG